MSLFDEISNKSLSDDINGKKWIEVEFQVVKSKRLKNMLDYNTNSDIKCLKCGKWIPQYQIEHYNIFKIKPNFCR